MTLNLREFALAISLVSFGSSQTFFLPQRKTLDARRFWSLSMLGERKGKIKQVKFGLT